MLNHLSIRNYTLIDSLEIDFPGGFSTITGETGSGKSIILGALGLLSGARADISLVRDRRAKAVIEAEFSSDDPALPELLERNGIDAAGEPGVILRREISPSGRSRAFVNDTPVNLEMLVAVTSILIDIHTQHNNILLADSLRQRAIIDSYGETASERETCRTLFREFAHVRAKLRKRREAMEEARANRSVIEFKLERLRALNLKKGELGMLEKKLDILADAEQIRSSLDGAYYRLEGGESNALATLSEAYSSLGEVDLSPLGADADLLQRFQNSIIELKDIAETIRRLASEIETSPRKLAETEQRLNDIYSTRKALGVRDADELVDMHDKLEQQLAAISGHDPEIEELESEYRRMAEKLTEASIRLSDTRKEAAKKFEKALSESAVELGLPNIRFEVSFEKGKIGQEGHDIVNFLCSFNKNSELRPLAKVASGGEISRLMLCIKALTAEKANLPTVIFDEIDTGVSGEIADRMARMMLKLGDTMQVITVTHLPQVAAKGASQFLVYKTDDSAGTHTSMRRLTDAEREEAIAAMLSGSSVNDAAHLNARTLLDDR